MKEETLAVPRLYVPIQTCMLRVIDNDTGRQLPSVFQKVAPYVYKRNKVGGIYLLTWEGMLGISCELKQFLFKTGVLREPVQC